MECTDSRDQMTIPQSFYCELLDTDAGEKREQSLALIITLNSLFKHNVVKGKEYTDDL